MHGQWVGKVFPTDILVQRCGADLACRGAYDSLGRPNQLWWWELRGDCVLSVGYEAALEASKACNQALRKVPCPYLAGTCLAVLEIGMGM